MESSSLLKRAIYLYWELVILGGVLSVILRDKVG